MLVDGCDLKGRGPERNPNSQSTNKTIQLRGIQTFPVCTINIAQFQSIGLREMCENVVGSTAAYHGM